MNIIQRIKRSLRQFLLRRLLKSVKRQRRVVDYGSAAKIGLLFGFEREEDPRTAATLIKQLKDDGKEISALGFVNAAALPEEVSVPEHTRLCCRKDFSWLLKPRRDFLKEFSDKEYDILIDLSSQHAHPMKFMAARSGAHFKTGAANPDTNDVFDLIMQVEEDCPAAELARHIIHYLKIIKTKHTDA